MAVVAVRSRLGMIIVGVDPDHVDRTKTYSAFGNHPVGEGADRRRRSAQQHSFQ